MTDVPSETDLSGYATETYVNNAVFSGNYNDLSNKPSIPSLSGYATETYENTAVSNLVASAPSALDTLNELALALGEDSNFSTTITNALANKANTSDIPSAYVLPIATYTSLGGIKISNTQQSTGANSVTSTPNRTYAVQRDSSQRAVVNVPWVSSSGGSSYSLPTAAATVKGGITTNYSTDANQRNYAVKMSGTNAYVNVPWTDNNTVYTLPTATSSSLGGIKIGYTENGKNYPVKLTSGKAYVNVPWENTVYTLPTAGNATLGGITTNYNTNVPSRNYAVQMSGTNAYVNVPVPAADAQNLGGVKVTFTNGNLYISTT